MFIVIILDYVGTHTYQNTEPYLTNSLEVYKSNRGPPSPRCTGVSASVNSDTKVFLIENSYCIRMSVVLVITNPNFLSFRFLRFIRPPALSKALYADGVQFLARDACNAC